ncbi:hypothetical protein X798_05231 [Onchocerca flexuosa]|uniref:Uncharacterized protein n=1 Tax=Onchocerca flexuosa TaxID=387005 RepID=A0A238BR74_9BILA|nr:hypothetical protein X798_05231 [Onchocerca flexuosa]
MPDEYLSGGFCRPSKHGKHNITLQQLQINQWTWMFCSRRFPDSGVGYKRSRMMGRAGHCCVIYYLILIHSYIIVIDNRKSRYFDTTLSILRLHMLLCSHFVI